MKHWAFDLDGTLVDSFSRYFVSLSDIFGARAKEFSTEMRVPALTQPLPLFFEQHLGREAVAAALSELQARSNEDAAHIQPFEGMRALIQELAENGARIGVWTNRDLTSAKLILKHSGLEPYIELCVSGSCVSQRKPNPEGLLRITEHFGCAPESITMVGDHEHDVTAAKGVGARAIRASWHSYWREAPCSNADFQFHRVVEFNHWVKQLMG